MKNCKFLLTVILIIIIQPIACTVNAQAIIKTGTYTGNGQNNHQMPVLNFRPDFLLIKGGNHSAQLALSGFQAGKTKDIDGGNTVDGLITGITNTGFILGNGQDVNKNGDNYAYLAIKELPGVVKVGTYTGNNTDDRNITGIGFAPELVIIVAETNNEKPIFSTIHMGADKSMNFLNSNFDKNCVQAFQSNGFQIGKDKAVNENGVTYHYVAMRSLVGSISIGSYTGNGANSRIINGTGNGNFTMVKTDKKNALFRTSELPADRSLYFKNTGYMNDRIKRNLPQGFEVGSDDEVNKSGEVYHYFQLYANAQVLPVEWLSFHAKVLATRTSLQWETAKETNNSHFLVERSTDAVNYSVIGNVAGKGTTSNISSYRFDDVNPATGTSYYRLRQVDDFGKISYSEVRKVVRTGSLASQGNSDYRIFPNPLSGNKVFVENAFSQTQTVVVDILNNAGVKLANVTLKNGNNVVDLPQNLPAGNFVLVGYENGRQLFTKRFIKVR